MIAQLPTETLEDVHNKENWEKDFQHNIERFRLLADIRTSTYFNNKIEWDMYNELVENLEVSDSDWDKLIQNKRIEKAHSIGKEKHFFHWELEFPEVFYWGNGKQKENPGFDSVIGNPPYGSKGILSKEEKLYCNSGFNFTESGDIAALFIEKSFEILRKKGQFGFIVPKPLSFITSWSDIREFLNGRIIRSIGDVSKAFTDVLLEQIIIICLNDDNPISNQVIIAGFNNKSLVQFGMVAQNIFEKRIFPVCRYGIDSLIANKIEMNTKPLNMFFKIWSGVGGITSNLSQSSIGPKILKGESIARYALTDDIWYVPSSVISATDIEEHKNERIVCQDIVAHVTRPTDHIVLMAIKIPAGTLTQETVINFSPLANMSLYDLGFLLSIINSNLNSWYTYRFIFNKAIRTMHYRPGYADYSLIRVINFTTQDKERALLFKHSKKLYHQYLETQDRSKIIAFTMQQLPAKEGIPDIGHEHSDVIHDLLAFLSEEMIRLYKEKQEMIRDFLNWLEKEVIKSSIKNQKNKTMITEFYENDLDHMLDVLKINKVISDPYPAEKRSVVDNEFSVATNSINSLSSKITLTNELIDQIIYELYGLNEEEIAVVEGKKS